MKCPVSKKTCSNKACANGCLRKKNNQKLKKPKRKKK